MRISNGTDGNKFVISSTLKEMKGQACPNWFLFLLAVILLAYVTYNPEKFSPGTAIQLLTSKPYYTSYDYNYGSLRPPYYSFRYPYYPAYPTYYPNFPTYYRHTPFGMGTQRVRYW
jgi:hypothetical protein